MRSVVSAVILTTLLGCTTNTVFNDFVDTSKGWGEQDTLVFVLNVSEEALINDISITIRNSIDYPYYNLYYRYQIISQTDQVMNTDLKEVILFDPKSGKPYGSGLGDVYDHEFVMLAGHVWENPGTYSIRIVHYMRRDTLSSIDRVGLKVMAIP